MQEDDFTDNIEFIAREVARLIEKKTKFRIGDASDENFDPDLPLEYVPSSEIWDMEAGITPGTIFYELEGAEVFADSNFSVIGSVPFADPNFFEKMIELVKGL